ncbi:MAG: heterodisulfide reductase-related iron-sulfur binding cluster [Myxococcota bacterium]
MRPEQPPALDPNDPRYWDPRDLEKELERVFTICHGCRMCVGFCGSFPEMFDRVDRYVDRRQGEIEAFDDQDYQVVNDLCFQCKLCYFKCPYTPDDDHAFMLDFPRLMLRHKAQKAKRDGVTVQDRVLGEPQLLGQLGGLGAPLSNLVSKNRLLRKVQEAATGISAEFNLPPFASRSVYKWWRDHEPRPEAGEKGAVALFATCTVNYNLPAGGAAAIQILEHNGYAVHFPKDQTCCGMPNMDGGDMEAAVDKARRNVALLHPHVRAGRAVVVPGPTCSYVLKKDYPELLGTDEAREVAEHTYDLMEYVRKLQREKTLRTDFTRSLGRVGYHAPCHLRAQKVGFPTMQVLKKIPNTKVSVIQECSAVDGTWGMKSQHYEMGRKYAKKLVGEIRDGDFDLVATDCPLSGQRLAQELGVVPYHPAEILNAAYGLPSVRDEPVPTTETIAAEEVASPS